MSILHAIKRRVPARWKRLARNLRREDPVAPPREPGLEDLLKAGRFESAKALLDRSGHERFETQRRWLGQWTEAKSQLLNALDAIGIEGTPDATVRDALGRDDCPLELADLHRRFERHPEIAMLVARLRQLQRLLRSPAASTQKPFRLLNAADLRSFLEDKTVALVANSGALVGRRKGAEIDAHDCVIRFNSFKIDPEDTGEKTTIHAATRHYPFNLDKRVRIRIIFSDSHRRWKRSVVADVAPDAQERLGDATLLWPVRSEQLVDAPDSKVPTAGLNIIRLLHLFGVARSVKLYGFDGYASGALRLDAAMELPVAAPHDHAEEQAWLRVNTAEIDDVTRELVIRPRTVDA